MDICKDLIATSATPLVLAILAEGESYGYAILKRVSEHSDGELEWTDGMLYPVIERLGFVVVRWRMSEIGRRRRYFRFTQEGRLPLREQCRQWEVVDSTLRSIWKVTVEKPCGSMRSSPAPKHFGGTT